jgi:glycosyltransferase involved in cell wall biosynthesis
MRILLLNNMDVGGGGIRAGYRLHEGLRRIGVEATMLVQTKLTTNTSVVRAPGRLNEVRTLFYSYMDALPMMLYRDAWWWKDTLDFRFTPGWVTNNTAALVNGRSADLVNMHMGYRGFVGVKTLAKFKCPVVWTMHDAEAFTGGCHYPANCRRYEERCGKCPQLGSSTEYDVSRWVWKRKRRHWKALNLTFVSPSRWLAEVARESSLLRSFRIEVIPNGLDTQAYRPYDKDFARDWLGVPRNKKIILAGASEGLRHSRKGFVYLVDALKRLASNGSESNAELLIFGQLEPHDPPQFRLRTTYVGQLHDDVAIALVYSAADVFVAPSIQDNLPNTILESMSCGTPCVAFRIGGMPDMIEHERTGYLAEPFDSQDLCRGIQWVLDNEERWRLLSRNGRERVESEFTLEIAARRYQDLFKDVLTPSRA